MIISTGAFTCFGNIKGELEGEKEG